MMSQDGPFDEEELDEIPISSLLFFNSYDEENNSNNGNCEGSQEECGDPLMIEPSTLHSGEDPLEACTPTSKVVKNSKVYKKRSRLKREKNVDPTPPKISLPSTSKMKSVTSSSHPPPPQNTIGRHAGNQLKTMTCGEFTQDMKQNIHNIVRESIGLFGRDPREYHPVYLRIYKYITIGQKLGYVATDEAYISSVWKGYFKFAVEEFTASQKQARTFTEERSAYATYLLTRKLIVNGKVVTEKRNDIARQKMFKEVEAAAKRIRNEWDNRAPSGGEIIDDLSTRLEFFKECMIVTHPADCLKMNNLWTKFLSKEGFSKRRKGCENRNTSLIVAPKKNSEVPLITIPSDEETDDYKEEESRKSVRKTIKVIVNPSFSPFENDSVLPSTITSARRSPSPVCSPAAPSPLPSPPCSPAATSPFPPDSPAPASLQPSSSTLVEAEPSITSNSEQTNKKTNQNSLKRIHKNVVKNKFAQGKFLKRKTIKKTCSTSALGKAGALKSAVKLPLMTSILKKKRKLLTGVASHNDVSRQLMLEKIINQGNTSKLLTGVVRRRKQVEKIDTIEKQTEEGGQKSNSTKILSSSLPPSSLKINNTGTTSKKLLKLKKTGKATETRPSTVKKQVPVKTPSLFDKQKKDRALLVLKKRKNEEILQKRVNKSNCQKKRKKKLKGSKREKMLARKRETFSFYAKYGRLRLNCPIATCQMKVALSSFPDHLKSCHQIVEDGKLWQCPMGCKRSILRRDSWLGHIEHTHGMQENIEELIEKARNLHSEVVLTGIAVNRDEQVRSAENKSDSNSATQSGVNDPTCKPSKASSKKKEAKQKPRMLCDECGDEFDIYYMPVHKDLKHNENRRKINCPVCKLDFVDVKLVWVHYCEFHLDEKHPLKILDPFSEEKHLPQIEVTPGQRVRIKKKEYTPVSVSSVCHHCGKDFSNPQRLVRHLYQAHGEGKPRHENLQCQYCQKKFKAKETMMAHISRIHEGKVNSKCQHCSKELQTPGKLWRHLIDNHGETPFEAAAKCEINFVQCFYCGLELLQGKQLNSHIRTQHPEHLEEFLSSHAAESQMKIKYRRINAPSSHLKYSESKLEMRRIKKREERRLWREEGIGPAWIQRESPAYRQKDKPGDCAKCGERFPKLQQHMRSVHKAKNTRSMPCPFENCKTALKTSRTLKVHIRTCHSSVINEAIVNSKLVKVVDKTPAHIIYQCTPCKEYMYHFEEVKVHIVASHPEIFADVVGSDNVPAPIILPPPAPSPEFLCPHCPSKFSKDEDVRSHVEQAHLELCWRCPACSKVMLSPDDFEKHFGVEHTGEKRKENDDKEEEDRQEKSDNFLKLTDLYYRKKRPVRQKTGNKSEIPESQTGIEHLREKMRMRVQCEICGTIVSMRLLTTHVANVHQVEEDTEPLLCKLCPGCVPFNIGKDGGRSNYLYHMEKYHSEEVDMEEVVRTISKIYTKTDWRTMNVANPTWEGPGRKRNPVKNDESESDTTDDEEETSEEELKTDAEELKEKNVKKVGAQKTRKLAKKVQQNKRKAKTKNESDDEEEEISEAESSSDKSDWKAPNNKKRKMAGKKGPGKKIKNERQAPVPVRASSRRSRTTPVKYAAFFNDEDPSDRDDDDIDVKQNIRNKPSVISRSTNRVKMGSVKNCQKSESSMFLAASIEKEKRLLIKLTRLTEEELSSRHLCGSQKKTMESVENTPKITIKREQLDEQDIVNDQIASNCSS